MIETANFESVEIASFEALRAWLTLNYTQEISVWLITFKKHKGDKYLSTDQILDALISYGWIDGIRRKLDDDRTMQLVGPRKNQAWAKTYKDRAARLIAEGRMHQSGLAAIEASKAHGLWDATIQVDALIVPDDLRRALDALDQASAYFDAAAPSYRRNVLRWIFTAKTDATRQKRLAQTASTSARHERIPQL